MEEDPELRKLLESFLQLCDTMVEKSYVVTNGLNVAGVVLQKKLAEHICFKMRNSYRNGEEDSAEKWIICSIPQALRYSFERGYEEAFRQIMQQQKMSGQQTCEEVSLDNEKLAQNPKREFTDEEVENEQKHRREDT